jgi:hypothetical protein
MQGPIAQTLALAIYGNAAVQGLAARDFFPSHSTCTFCKSVSFVLLDWEKDEWRLKPFAATPQDWILRLRNAGAKGFVVLWESLDDRRISDRESVGFVAGGGRWLIEALLPRSAELWEAAWEVGNTNDPENRVWKVTWTRVARRNEAFPIGAMDLDALQKDLKDFLPEIADFARRHDLETFVPFFERGLACLGSEAPLGEVYHKDLAPPGFLSLQAERLLAVAQAAWVFGGMGSWNDIGFAGAEQEEYEQLSDRLYHLLNKAAICAANSSSPQLPPIGEEPTRYARAPQPHLMPHGSGHGPSRSLSSLPVEGEKGYETHYNLKGLLFFAIGAGLGLVGEERRWWGIFDSQFIFAVGMTLMALDLVYRVTVVRRELAERTEPMPQPAPSPFVHRGDENSWLTSSLGGSLIYYPAWIVGIVFAVLVGGLVKYYE